MSSALTVIQVAVRLSVSAKTVRKLITTGTLRAFRVGPRRWRIDPDDLTAYMDHQRAMAAKKTPTPIRGRSIKNMPGADTFR